MSRHPLSRVYANHREALGNTHGWKQYSTPYHEEYMNIVIVYCLHSLSCCEDQMEGSGSVEMADRIT